MPEVQGTVKVFSKSKKGFILKEYDDQWFNRGKDFEGAWPALVNQAITVTYEQTQGDDGTAKFWVLEAWPTSTGKPTAQPAAPSGPVPTNGPKPAQPDSYDGYRATGPVPTPPSRENAILFQVCLKAAQEWVLATTAEGSPQRVSGEVLAVADTYYHEGLRLISGEPEEPQDGDPGPEPPA